MIFKNKSSDSLYHFDSRSVLHIPSLQVELEPGKALGLLGVKGTDVTSVFQEFCNQMPKYARSRNTPFIQCVMRNRSIFPNYTAYENFSMPERSICPLTGKALFERCNDLKQEFRIPFSFHVPLKDMTVSQQILIEFIRAYISEASVIVCDNLLSLMSMRERQILITMAETLTNSGRSLLYLTSKWEFITQITTDVIIFTDRTILGTMNTEQILQSPERLMYLVSGRSLIEQDESVENPTKMLSMLYSGAEYMANNYSLRDSLIFVCNNVNKVLGSVFTTIYLHDEESNRFHHFSNTVDAPVLVDSFVMRFLDNFPNLTLSYATKDDPYFDSFFETDSHEVLSFLAMPVVHKSSCCGVLATFFSFPVIYDESLFAKLKSFCRETAIIIETSHLLGSSILLQESNHRIKNNLQVILSLLTVQQLHVQMNPEVDVNAMLESIINRIHSIAKVHELLVTKGKETGHIALQDLLNSVLMSLPRSDIQLIIHSDNILISHAKANSLAMVVSELTTNCYKYAFPGHWCSAKEVHINCRIIESNIQVQVQDTGIGISKNFSFAKSGSMGCSIIQTLVHNDLHGSITIKNTGHGTLATVLFPYA